MSYFRDNDITSNQRMQENKKLNLRLAKIYNSISVSLDSVAWERRANRVSECADGFFIRQCDCGHVTGDNAVATVTCNDRLCPVCAARWSARWRAYMFHLSKILDGHEVIFITLTQKNCKRGKLREEIQKMAVAFNRLLHQKVMTNVRDMGYLRKLEVTYNADDDTWHPHLHIIMVVNPSYYDFDGQYIDERDLKRSWRKAMKLDYLPQCRIVKATQTVCEMSKYTVKNAIKMDMPFDDVDFQKRIIELHSALENRRKIQAGGTMSDMLRAAKMAAETAFEREDENLPDTCEKCGTRVRSHLYKWVDDVYREVLNNHEGGVNHD